MEHPYFSGVKEKLKDYGNAKYSQSVSVSDGRIISILNKIKRTNYNNLF